MSSSSTSFQARNQYLPTLSCEFCRQRKIKCDKLNPCTNCQKAGVNCESVRRKRLPRGRHTRKPGGSTQELKDKIDRLEALVNGAIADSSSSAATASRGGIGKEASDVAFPAQNALAPNAEPAVPSPSSGGSTTESGSMTTKFWANVIQEIREVQGLASEDTEEDEDGDDDDQVEGSAPRTSSYFMGLSLGRLGGLHSLSLRPSRSITVALCDVYLNHVDRIIKVLHRPSLKQHLLDGTPYPGCRGSSDGENALDAAVFYAAVASMTDRQCHLHFQCRKMDVLPEYQSACETALERADLMRTTDMTVLQAFVLYLVATRAHDKSRAVWTLLATAVRIAQALNLHVESLHPTETLFNQQMRKRLWFTICLLDAQSCIDPDSQPLIPLEKTQVTLPRNVNDTDFDASYEGHDITDREEVTDMTFALVTYNLQAFGRRLYSVTPQEWSTREELVASFRNSVSSLTKYCNPDNSNYSWFVYYGTQSLLSTTQLHIFKRLASTINMSPPNQGSSSMLELCLKSIENTPRMQSDERGEGFRWYITPQWPPLVVAIRECYVSADAVLVKRVWPLVESVFEHYKKSHTDPNGRARTRMLRKLMEKTRERVNALIQSAEASSIDSQNSAMAPAPPILGLFQDPAGALSDATMIHIENQPIEQQINPSWSMGWDDLFNELSYGVFPDGYFFG